jgi:hypothetical protein
MKTLQQAEQAPTAPAEEWSPSVAELYLAFKHGELDDVQWNLQMVAEKHGPYMLGHMLADAIASAKEKEAEHEKQKTHVVNGWSVKLPTREKRKASTNPEDPFQAALANGVKPATFLSRIKNGWSMERAISTPTRAYTQRRRGHMACPPSKIDELLTSMQRVLNTPDPDPTDGLLHDAIRISLLGTYTFEDEPDDLDFFDDCMGALLDRYLAAEGKGMDARQLAMRILEHIPDAIEFAEKAERGK